MPAFDTLSPELRSPRRRGFTIVEISISLVIGILLLLGIFTLWRSGNKIFRKADANTEAVQSASFVMAVISDDLRNFTVTREMLKSGGGGLAISDDGKVDPGRARKVLNAAGATWRFPITDPDSTPPQLKYVEYGLKEEKSYGNNHLFHFTRKMGSDERTYWESYVQEVEFEFRAARSDKVDGDVEVGPNPVGSGEDRIYYVQVLVLGASTTLVEAPQGGVTDQFYHMPLLSLFCLDSVTERLSQRGLGKYWYEVSPPTAPTP